MMYTDATHLYFFFLSLWSYCKCESRICNDKFPWDNPRLPLTIYPMHYDLLVHPNLTRFEFSGVVSVVINVTEETNFILLNSADLDIESIEIVSLSKTLVPVTWLLCSRREQLAVITANGTTLPAGSYNLTIIFGGNLTGTLRGLYVSSYLTKSGEMKHMAVTQFSPTDARRMFPCWDEPIFKATFQISIVRDQTVISLSNMPLFSTRPLPNNLIRDDFETTLRMSTYLVAIAVCDFPRRTKRTSRGMEVSLYTPEPQINQTSYALEVAVDAIDFHEKYLKIPLPLKKLDIVAVGDFAFGAMENWGLMTFRDTIILQDREKATVQDEDETTQVITHEIGHQWFGNLVTMKWWSDLWLKEGFASFLQTYAASKMRPDWGLMEIYPQMVASDAFDLDGLNNTHAVHVPVGESSDIRGIFDAISYKKGASVIFMLLNILGEDNLVAGLHDYLTTYEYSNADGPQFWNILGRHASNLQGVQLSTIADGWTLQPGYPYVTVTADSKGITLHQRRFYYLQELAIKDKSPSSWTIPFTFVSDTVQSQMIWFNSTEHIVPFTSPVQWFKANVNGTGFYRVLYEPSVWHNFIERLKHNPAIFSPQDRTNLLMDAFAFVESGLLNVSIAFSLAEYLRSEMDYGPWHAALSSISSIEYMLTGKPLLESLRAYARSLLDPVYNRLTISWTEPSPGHKDRRFMATILNSACHFGMADCKKQALELFRNWLRDGTRIPSDFLATVMNEAIKENSSQYWNVVWEAYQLSAGPAEKRIYLMALCQSPEKEKLLWLLNTSLGRLRIRANLLPTVVDAVAKNPNGGTSLVWQFTKDNWLSIYKAAGGTAVLGNYLSYALAHVSEVEDFEDIRDFFSKRDVDGAKRSLEEVLERVQINLQWRKNNEQELQMHLEKAGPIPVMPQSPAGSLQVSAEPLQVSAGPLQVSAGPLQASAGPLQGPSGYSQVSAGHDQVSAVLPQGPSTMTRSTRSPY